MGKLIQRSRGHGYSAWSKLFILHHRQSLSNVGDQAITVVAAYIRPMLCPLSGLNPLGGPTRLINHEDLDTVSAIMAFEIFTYGQVSLDRHSLASIVSSALELTLPPPEDRDIYDLAPKLPDGVSDWEYFDPIGIGHFDEDGYCPVDEHGRCPSGRYVQMRRLDQYDWYGRFYGIRVDDEGGSGERLELKPTICWSGRTLDPSLPKSAAFMDSASSLSLEGELYEIINSRHEIRDYSGLFPSFQYGDILETWEEDQFRFFKARKGSHHTSHAIKAGLRGKELLPALFSDFQCWLSIRPDIWPSPTASSTPTFMWFPISHLSGPFGALPAELLLDILRHLPIYALLTLSSASRSLRALLTDPAFLNQTIKAAVLSGSEFWIFPVKAIAGEEGRALHVAMEWLATASLDRDILTTDLPFHSPSFPYLAFVHACYESDSMRNRQRLWNIVKQLDGLWRDYRLHGWQRDVFIA